jgi:internalin A
MSWNELTMLPAGFSHLVNVIELDLGTNPWQQLPPFSISQQVKLRRLALADLEPPGGTLPSSIGDLTGLTYLDLEGGSIQQLPDSISQLVHARFMLLGRNNLELLPDGIGSLTSLLGLYLEGNQLRELPDAISALTSLRNLDVGYNRLQQLPEAISALTALTALTLYNNELHALPSGLSSLQRLSSLAVDGIDTAGVTNRYPAASSWYRNELWRYREASVCPWWGRL